MASNDVQCIICLEKNMISKLDSCMRSCVCVKTPELRSAVSCECNYYIHADCYYEYAKRYGCKCVICKSIMILDFYRVNGVDADGDADGDGDADRGADREDTGHRVGDGHITISVGVGSYQTSNDNYIIDPRFRNIIRSIAMYSMTGNDGVQVHDDMDIDNNVNQTDEIVVLASPSGTITISGSGTVPGTVVANASANGSDSIHIPVSLDRNALCKAVCAIINIIIVIIVALVFLVFAI
jgi:hypothetical protein